MKKINIIDKMQDTENNNFHYINKNVRRKSQVEKIKNLENYVNTMLLDTTYYNDYISANKNAFGSNGKVTNRRSFSESSKTYYH